jgi:uncharacterized membrane protein YoaK (UPF0700 family)
MRAAAVDVIGLLALAGLFIAHITGNIVVLVAHCVGGGFSRVGPLVAVPVFITVLSTIIWAAEGEPEHQASRALLVLHAALLVGFLLLYIARGPFTNPSSAVAVLAGMLGVAAVATQNALVRLDLPGFPQTAVLNTNTVQLTIDIATLVRGNDSAGEMDRARRPIGMTLPALLVSLPAVRQVQYSNLYCCVIVRRGL